MSLHAAGWTAVIAGLGIAAQLGIASWSRRQAEKLSADTIAVQVTGQHRTVAAFIAAKRQKWIDELRADAATHLAESQEYVWKWIGLRNHIDEVMKDEQLEPDDRLAKAKEYRYDFSEKNGVLDRSHQERHHRLRFRLNPKELDHSQLREILDEIRKLFSDVAMGKGREPDSALIQRAQKLVEDADTLTSEILKTEWERVKQEVAYPDHMITKIPPPT
jgi:hypothetical protein